MSHSPTTAARYDLHLHTTRSDGRFAEGEVLERCAEVGLDVVALTDHDIATMVDPGVHTFGSRKLHVLSGAEISGRHHGREFHLLVYFPGAVPTKFHDFCGQQLNARVRRWKSAVENLGFAELPAPCRASLAGERALTRLHMAHALVELGRAKNVGDAFAKYLVKETGNVPPVDTPFIDAIRIARSFGGVTSWAHPTAADAWEFLPDFVAAGLQGIEILRPRVRGPDRRALRRLTRAHGLLVTGGSDWHGWRGKEELGLFVVRGHELRTFLHALEAAA